jgi:hypothetical protein
MPVKAEVIARAWAMNVKGKMPAKEKVGSKCQKTIVKKISKAIGSQCQKNIKH